MRESAPTVDFLDADFYVNGAREAYAWIRQHARASTRRQERYVGYPNVRSRTAEQLTHTGVH
jgi:hypothetical protein